MSLAALLNTLGTRSRSLPVVILYVTEGCNLRCMSCSYRAALPQELSLEEIARLADALKGFGLRRIVYSGGEPLLRRDFPRICTLFVSRGVSQTLLTNGVLLEKMYPAIREHIAEIIVSLDGPDAATHDGIRGAEAFTRIIRGIRMAAGDGARLSLRTVVQKRNFRRLPEIVRLGRDLGVRRVSFLPADVRSEGFGRSLRGAAAPESALLLDAGETAELRELITGMIDAQAGDFSSGFIAEPPEKLMRLADYFDACNGAGPFPAGVCNAPMVSAVITSTGDLLPCYFLPPYASIRRGPVRELVNGDDIRRTRSEVKRGTPEECHRCVCTLHAGPGRALLGRF